MGAAMWVLVATGAWPTTTGAWPMTAGAVKMGAGARRAGAGRGAWSTGPARGAACRSGAAGANRWLAEAAEATTSTVRATT